MRIIQWTMVVINLIGISLLLMIPIFNIYYMCKVTERNWFKECAEWWGLDVYEVGDEQDG